MRLKTNWHNDHKERDGCPVDSKTLYRGDMRVDVKKSLFCAGCVFM